MSTRITAAVIVAGLLFVQTLGPSVMSARANDILALLLLIAMSLLVVWTMRRQQAGEEPGPAMRIWAEVGWKIPAAIMTLAVAAVVATLLAWTWQPRADFDVLGVLWALQNASGIALIAIFGVVAIVSCGVVFQALAATRSGRQ